MIISPAADLAPAPTVDADAGWLDARPLIERFTAAGRPLPAGRDSARLRRAYHRAVERGQVTVLAADELAAGLLGVHPLEVWGDDWFQQL